MNFPFWCSEYFTLLNDMISISDSSLKSLHLRVLFAIVYLFGLLAFFTCVCACACACACVCVCACACACACVCDVKIFFCWFQAAEGSKRRIDVMATELLSQFLVGSIAGIKFLFLAVIFKLFSAWVCFCGAGMSGGVVSHPIDTVKVRMQLYGSKDGFGVGSSHVAGRRCCVFSAHLCIKLTSRA